jgi:hypothetical protein
LSAQDLNFTLADVDQSIDLSIGVLSKETYNPTFFLNKNFSEETTEALQSKFYLAESNNLNQNKGLYIKFRANYNFRDDYDEDLNGYLKGSVRGELEWRFFEEGLIDYKNQSKISLAKSKLYDFRSTEANSERGTQFLGFYIRQMINFEEKQILLEELKSYNLLFDVCSNLFSQRLISRNQLIDLGYKISNIEIQLDVLVNENIDYERITKIDSDFDLILPFFQIDFSQIQFDTYSDEEELMNDIVEFEEKSVNNYRLALYVSENYTFSESQSNLFPSAGIRFTVPLRSNNRKERIELKKSVNSSEIREKRVNQKLQRGAIYKSFSFNNAELSRLVEEQDILIDQIRVKTLLNSELKSEAVDLELVQLKFRQFDLLKSLLRIKEEQYLNLVELYGIFNLDIPEHAISEYYPKSSLNMSIVHFSESDAFDFDFQFSYLISIGARQICVEDNDTQAANYLRENDTEFFIDRCTKYVSIEKLIRQDMKTLKLEF